MNIVLLQAAQGEVIDGPNVRVPPGNYDIQRTGSYSQCFMNLNGAPKIELNSHIVLSNHSTINLTAKDAKDLTVKFIRRG